jgi:hypothetical protein
VSLATFVGYRFHGILHKSSPFFISSLSGIFPFRFSATGGGGSL